MNRNKDEDDLEEYQEKVEAITGLYRRRPHNMIEEVEKLGFKYDVDDGEDADEIAEEKTARPANENEKRLVSFLENRAEPDDKTMALWCQETQKGRCLGCALAAVFPHWQRPIEKVDPVST